MKKIGIIKKIEVHQTYLNITIETEGAKSKEHYFVFDGGLNDIHIPKIYEWSKDEYSNVIKRFKVGDRVEIAFKGHGALWATAIAKLPSIRIVRRVSVAKRISKPKKVKPKSK